MPQTARKANERHLHEKRQGLNLPQEHIKSLLAAEENDHWWFAGRVAWACHLIDNWLRTMAPALVKYVDLGCGTGGFASAVAKRFEFDEVTLIDKDPNVLQLASRFGGFHKLQVEFEKPFELPVKPSLVTCMDVVEHIADDQKFVCEISKLMSPNGLLVVSVPAHQALYSQWDNTLGHYRRYSKDEVGRLLETAGLRVVSLRYMWSFLAPFGYLRKMRKRGHPKAELPAVPRLINSLLIGLSGIERQVTDLLPLPFGTSVIASATKPL